MWPRPSRALPAAVAAAAFSAWISTPRQPRHYVLVDALAKVPAKASIVFRDNGAVIYTP